MTNVIRERRSAVSPALFFSRLDCGYGEHNLTICSRQAVYLDIFDFLGTMQARWKRIRWKLTMLLIFKSILTVLLPILSVFLILLILVQRGRGGGLVGAFGGAGGQSAFGAKAGDLFTKITVVTVCFWILFCIGLLLLMKQGDLSGSGGFGGGGDRAPITSPADSDAPVTVPIPLGSPQD